MISDRICCTLSCPVCSDVYSFFDQPRTHARFDTTHGRGTNEQLPNTSLTASLSPRVFVAPHVFLVVITGLRTEVPELRCRQENPAILHLGGCGPEVVRRSTSPATSTGFTFIGDDEVSFIRHDKDDPFEQLQHVKFIILGDRWRRRRQQKRIEFCAPAPSPCSA